MKTPRALFIFMTLALPIGTFGAAARADTHDRLAQGEVIIPTEAQIDGMQTDAITVAPLDVSEGAQRGGEAAEIRQMDRRAHRIDERLLTEDGVCDGC
jgi:hypothetical protein